MECDSPCELLLDFNMAVVATAKDFSDAESMGWEALFAEIKNYERALIAAPCVKLQVRDKSKIC